VIELEAVYAIWLREAKVYMRERERLVSSVISPLLWLFVFSVGVGGGIAVEGADYQAFVFPGILLMAMLFTAVFYGLYIIWDRKLDFLKEVLVAPASRSSIFLGKALGGITNAMVQAIILLIIGAIFILPISLVQLAYVIPLLLLIGFSMASMGLVIGANLRSEEGFGLASNVIIWPMFFFSGALFPLDNLPLILKQLSLIDPITYAVDALRTVLLGTGAFPMYYDLGILVLFAVVTGALGLISFGNLQQAK
jgi:ABC-2 type transport system permease protein